MSISEFNQNTATKKNSIVMQQTWYDSMKHRTQMEKKNALNDIIRANVKKRAKILRWHEFVTVKMGNT